MDTPWWIEMLGWLRAVLCEQQVTRFRRQKTGGLLAYLAYHCHRSHPRELLIELLWPECDPVAGRNRLSVALSSLRRQLEPPGIPAGGVILADHRTVQLNPEAVSTDVAAFEAALRAAHAAPAVERVRRLTAACQLYSGELLPGYFDPWILSERQRLAGSFQEAVEWLLALLQERGDYALALPWARRLVSAEPLGEASHQALIRLLMQAGQPDAALQHYQEWERLLWQSADLAPDPETCSLVREIQAHTIRVPHPAADGPLESSPRVEPPAQGVVSTPLPSGTVTFLVVGLAEAPIGDSTASGAERALGESWVTSFRQGLPAYGGCELPLVLCKREAAVAAPCRPGFAAAFARASEAVAFVLEMASAGHSHAEADGTAGQKSRSGGRESGNRVPDLRWILHTDEVVPGEPLVACDALRRTLALLSDVAPGGILLSETTAVLLQGRLAPSVEVGEWVVEGREDRDRAPRLFRLFPPAPVSAERATFPGEMAPTPHLPLQVTRFFGRERELAQLHDALTGRFPIAEDESAGRRADGAGSSAAARLMTLTGPGGSGKTRLAIEMARQLSPHWSGMIWFVPLQEVRDSGQIVDRILSALHLIRSPQVDSWDQVVTALSARPSMLILDNFEQLVPDGITVVQRLLAGIPSVTLLITSRRLLGLSGEQELPVLPLPVPGEGEERRDGKSLPDSLHLAPESLIGCPSVRLFVDRAQAVRPDFQVTRANAAAVAGICARLEGLPLALELGAARIGVLTPAQMLARIEERFEWLATRKRGVVDRHRSLRAALAWSYALLSSEQQRCFCRLSVFRGGWTLAGVEAVCGQGSTRDHLVVLLEASLVQAEGSGDARRYRMLETLREYGSEQIAAPERSDAARLHLEFYLSLAEEADAALRRPEQASWIERLELEHDNLRVALDWAIANGHVIAGARLAVALRQFWIIRAYMSEGRQQLARLLEHAELLPEQLHARALNAAGSLASTELDDAVARPLYEAAMRIWDRLNDRRGVAACLLGLAKVEGNECRFPQECALIAQAAAIYREVGTAEQFAQALGNLGLAAAYLGDHELAEASLREALDINRELGNRYVCAINQNNLAIVLLARGDAAGACELFSESMAVKWEIAGWPTIGWSLAGLAEVAAAQGQPERAARLFGAAEAVRRRVGNEHPPSAEGAMRALREKLGPDRYEAAWTDGFSMPVEAAFGYALQSTG